MSSIICTPTYIQEEGKIPLKIFCIGAEPNTTYKKILYDYLRYRNGGEAKNKEKSGLHIFRLMKFTLSREIPQRLTKLKV